MKSASAAYVGPVVTTDAVVMQIRNERLWVLTHRRPREPFVGKPALPGVYVNAGETIADATERCLESKVGLKLPPEHFQHVLGVRDSVSRDPRGHALSIVVLILLPTGYECEPSGWTPANRIKGLAFDHDDIVHWATGWLGDALWVQPSAISAAVGTMPLTTATFVTIQTALVDSRSPVDVSNLRRKILASGVFAPTRKTMPGGGRGRPSAMWRWLRPPAARR